MKLKSLILFTFVSLSTQAIFAKSFSSKFCEFELPSGWECAIEGTEWICQSENKERQKEAIIILAAKMRGDQDSLEQYQEYLKKPKTFKLPGDKTQVSEAKSVEVKTINNQRWVDALHLASEVPGFYTRYLATVKENLGIAVTFSVAKDHYASYQELFDKVVATLKAFDQTQLASGQWTAKKESENLLEDSTFIPDGQNKQEIAVNKVKGKGGAGGDTELMMYGALALIVIVVLMKLKKKK